MQSRNNIYGIRSRAISAPDATIKRIDQALFISKHKAIIKGKRAPKPYSTSASLRITGKDANAETISKT